MKRIGDYLIAPLTMGRTYRREKRWGQKSSAKHRLKKGREVKKPEPIRIEHTEHQDWYENLEMETDEEEYNERLRKKGSNGY